MCDRISSVIKKALQCVRKAFLSFRGLTIDLKYHESYNRVFYRRIPVYLDKTLSAQNVFHISH